MGWLKPNLDRVLFKLVLLSLTRSTISRVAQVERVLQSIQLALSELLGSVIFRIVSKFLNYMLDRVWNSETSFITWALKAQVFTWTHPVYALAPENLNRQLTVVLFYAIGP